MTEFSPAKTVYLPGDIPQISNLISISISFRFKFISSWESLIIVTEQGKHLLVHRAVPENTPNKTSPAVKKKLFVRSPTMQNIWKIIHTIFSIIIIIIIIIFFCLLKRSIIIYINPSNIFARTRLVLTHLVTEFSPAKTGGYSKISPGWYSPNFKPYIHYDKFLFQIYFKLRESHNCYRTREAFACS